MKLFSYAVSGFTALHASVLSSVVKTAELLLAAGANPNVLDDDGKNYLRLHEGLFRKLLSILLHIQFFCIYHEKKVCCCRYVCIDVFRVQESTADRQTSDSTQL